MALLRRAVAAACVLVVSIIGLSAAPTSASVNPPTITSVTFSGPSGPLGSPTVTIVGTRFGAIPTGTSDNVTSCGTYVGNGDSYGTKFYFLDSGYFEAGFGHNCIGLVVQSWTSTKIVFTFGAAYGSFTRWYLENGDGYAVYVKQGLWGGSVSGLIPAP